jgi:hypothetical protein
MRPLRVRLRILRTGTLRPTLERVLPSGPNTGRLIRITATVA